MLAGVQVIILNNIQLHGYINPYLYVLFILLLPVKFSRVGTLLLALGMGLTIDMFTDTAGMHAMATVFMGYCRPLILKTFAPRDGYEADAIPDIKEMGLQWFLLYCFLLVLIHHFALFYIEIFRFAEFFITLLRVALSTIVTVFLIIIIQYFFGRKNKARGT